MSLPAGLEALLVGWVALLGACVGSFLNVVIARVPSGESVVRPGSRCPRCRSPIAWYDNVPIVSWLALRGRCRRCGVAISPRYLVVEALGAAAAVGAWARHGFTPAALAELGWVAALLALAAIDLDVWLLPNALTWPVLAAGVALGATGVTPAGALRPALYGAGIGFAAFALVSVVGARLLRREALGFGDVWLLAALGAWLGVQALLPVVLLASVQGSVIGVALIALGRSQPGPQPTPGAPAGPAPDAPAAPAGGTVTAGAPSGAAATTTPGDESAAARPAPADAAPEAAGIDAPAATSVTPAGPGALDEEDWVPPRHAVPFGPFLVAAALEWLYLAPWAVRHVPGLEVFR